MDCLPVLGQLTLRLVRSARFFGRVFPSYKSPMLCFSIGPSFKITEFTMSCVPPHLLQRATILYRATELFVVSGIASCMPSFSCMAARIVRCFGRSVKDKEKQSSLLDQSQTNSKITSLSLSHCGFVVSRSCAVIMRPRLIWMVFAHSMVIV
jgi:hypothetical protein